MKNNETAGLRADFTIIAKIMMCAYFDQNRKTLKSPKALDHYANLKELQEE